jgi:hypothetical protein
MPALRWILVSGALGAAALFGASFLPGVSTPLRNGLPTAESIKARAVSLLPATTEPAAVAPLAAAGAASHPNPVNKCVAGGRTAYTDAPCPAGAKSTRVDNDRLTVVPAFVGKKEEQTTVAAVPGEVGASSVPAMPVVSSVALGQETLKKAMGVQQELAVRQQAADRAIERASK